MSCLLQHHLPCLSITTCVMIKHAVCFSRFGSVIIIVVTMVTIISNLYQIRYLNTLLQWTRIRQVPYLVSPYLVNPHGPPGGNLSNRFIIYRCQRGLCGGLADRQKGIVMSYIMSQMLRRNFGIIMNKGCNLSDFLIPNQVDWIVREDSIRGLKTKTVHVVDYGVQRFFQNLNCRSLECIFSEDVVYFEGNMDYLKNLTKDPLFANVNWAANKTESEIFQIAFSQLFRFSSRTYKRYDEFRAKTENKSLVCTHLRMGRSTNNPLDTRSSHSSPNVSKVIERLKVKLTKDSLVFVATDSLATQEEMKRTFPKHYVDLPGTILHVDHPVGRIDCSGMEKAILDQYILSKCHTLFISKSGFSQVAAMLRGSVGELYQAGPRSVRPVS